MLIPGEMFDRYRLDARIGQGGMGEVFKAHDTKLGRTVALKVLNQRHTAGDGAARLVREARAAATILHPNAVAVFDVGEVDGVPYIAMEYVEGKTLRAYVGDASVPMATRVQWLADVARALGAAHAKGIVHRDVKPENIMISTDGVVKVLDFGLARAQATMEDSALGTITHEGVIVGSLAYMAPEQLRGEELDGRADQWGWAVVAYELLVGKRPWNSVSNADLVAEILNPRSREMGISNTRYASTVRRALARHRSGRFSSMELAANELEGVAARSEERMIREAPTRSARIEDFGRSDYPARAKGVAFRTVPIYAVLLIAVAITATTFFVTREKRDVPLEAVRSNEDVGSLVESVIGRLTVSRPASAAGGDRLRRAVRSLLDADLDAARRDLEELRRIEPTVAVADVMVLLLPTDMMDGARAHLSDAFRGREQLTPFARALVDAWVPAYGVGFDSDTTVARLDRIPDNLRDDLLYPAQRLAFLASLGRLQEARAEAAILRGAHSNLAIVWSHSAVIEFQDARDHEALEYLEECLKRSEHATNCLMMKSRAQAALGACAPAERTARELLAVDSNHWASHTDLLGYRMAQGASGHAIEPMIETAVEKMDAEVRLFTELQLRTHVAWESGRLGDALHHALTWREKLRGKPGMLVAAEVVERLSEELEDCPSALSTASEALQLAVALSFDGVAEGRIVHYASQYRCDVLSSADWRRRRDEWLQNEGSSFLRADLALRRWVDGFGSTLLNADDANDAIAYLVRMRLHRQGAAFRQADEDGALGRAYLLAGRVNESIPILTGATNHCDVIGSPWARTSAALDLARAHELRGELSAACAAYQVVVSRSGREPRSVSGKRARERSAALKCPKEITDAGP